MMKIGLLSDTHAYLDNRILYHLDPCDEIWHAGDIGTYEVLEKLRAIKPVRAVYGNIDGQSVRSSLKEIEEFTLEEVPVIMKHIGGYPGRYDRSIRDHILANPPRLFISGHSHILKVMPDKKLGLLHINPGAAGKSGLHRLRTLVRFVIDGDQIRDLEVVELEKR